jgi:hypothetical protein
MQLRIAQHYGHIFRNFIAALEKGNDRIGRVGSEAVLAFPPLIDELLGAQMTDDSLGSTSAKLGLVVRGGRG